TNVSRETSGPSDAGRRLADGPALPAAGAAALLNPYLADSPIERLRLSDTVGRSFANGWLRDRKGQLRDGGFCYGAIGERTLPMTARLRSVKHFPKGNI
ncbi:MAG: hypothetical protein ACLU7P_12225, partial [Eggerthella lenta]